MCVWCKWWGVCETGHVVRVCVCVCDMSGAVCLCDVYVQGLHMGGAPLQPWGEAPQARSRSVKNISAKDIVSCPSDKMQIPHPKPNLSLQKILENNT